MAPDTSNDEVRRLGRDPAGSVDHTDGHLFQFTTDRGTIRSGRTTGNCARHQREVAMAINSARQMALVA